MEKRIQSDLLKSKIGQKVTVAGRIYSIRKLGGINFVILQDRAGLIQAVFDKKAGDLKIGSWARIEGEAKEEKRAFGGAEIQGERIEVFSQPAGELPFDLSKKELSVNLKTLLDHRPLTIRHEKVRSIFKIYATLIAAYAGIMRSLGFLEIKTPKILGAASEGGANFFGINYFGKKAFLAQSPQFYKQICVGAFERVFEIGPVFRAEKHFTTRHINEYTSLDAEMGFIESYEDVMGALTEVLSFVFKEIREKNQKEMDLYGAIVSDVPEKIPRYKLVQIKEIIKEKYGYEVPPETDIDPKGEALAGQFAKEELRSDFIFITHYPRSMRPFYTMPDEENPEETKGFDLLFKGVELVTGSQRIHDYKQLVQSIKKAGLNPKEFSFYLEAFKYGMPPHGGWGMGSERLVQQLLNLSTIKEAVLFPRDVKRLWP
jgi:nondiscriminating aspartyl-tRNA synthetase